MQAAISVLAAPDPWSIKAIGKKIAPIDDYWSSSEEAMAAMRKAVWEKFTQNTYLSDVLLSTGELILAEANPHDTIWGIGLTKNHKDTPNASNWPGKNQLGAILMNVRGEIRQKLAA